MSILHLTPTVVLSNALIYYFHLLLIGIPRTHSIGKIYSTGVDVTDNMPNSEDAARRGEYTVIRSLVRVLEVRYLVFCFRSLVRIHRDSPLDDFFACRVG